MECSSILFDFDNIKCSRNKCQDLSDLNDDYMQLPTTPHGLGPPLPAFSPLNIQQHKYQHVPKTTKTIANYQRILPITKNKNAEFLLLIGNCKPYIIIGTESKELICIYPQDLQGLGMDFLGLEIRISLQLRNAYWKSMK